MAGLGGNGPGSSHLSQEEAAHWQILQLVTTESNWCGFAVVLNFFFMLPQLGKSQNSPFGADFVSIWSPGDNSVPVRTYFTLAPSGKEMWLAVVESIQQNRERKEKLSERLSFCLRLCHVTSRISKLFIVQHNQHWRDSWQIQHSNICHMHNCKLLWKEPLWSEYWGCFPFVWLTTMHQFPTRYTIAPLLY